MQKCIRLAQYGGRHGAASQVSPLAPYPLVLLGYRRKRGSIRIRTNCSPRTSMNWPRDAVH